MDKQTRINLFYILVAVAGVMILQSIFAPRAERVQIPYSEFRQLVTDGKVTEAVITEHHIEGVLRTPLRSGATRFITRRVDPDLAADLATQGVKVTGATEDTFLHRILSWTLPMMLFLGLWFFLVRRMGQGGLGGSYMALGKSKAKVYMEKDTKVTFKDVAGVDEAKEELEEIVAFLKDPKRYGRLGAHVPKGVLLVGPPGTGKTLLARAVAGEAGVPFFSINGSEFVEMFVGLGAARVRDLFEQGRQKVPCIIFIDELDALGRARGAGPMSGGHDEKEQTLNQLLSEMDGFDPSEGLVLLAATNRPEILDPALLRAGRFDRQVLVDRPDKIGREAILRVHLKKALLNTDVNPEQLAALTPGFTGADLANLVNEAALLATRRDAKDVTMDDFTRAIERIVAGLEKKTRILNDLERRTVAWHETGHALVALALPGSGKVHKVSIIPRGIGALGYTIQRPTEDRYLMTQAELENKMAVLLGGRAAEYLVFGRLSTGAADDLAKATDIARSMVTQYGMIEKLGHVVLDKRPTTFLGGDGGFPWQPHTYSEETAREIDCAVREIVQTAFDRATTILTRNRAILDRTAEALLEAETLDEDTLGTLSKGLQQDAAA